MAACNQTFQSSGPVGNEKPEAPIVSSASCALAFTSLQASCK